MSASISLDTLRAQKNYDFSNLTNNQLLTASGELYKEGKITVQEDATLMGFAVDYAPMQGESLPPGEGLNSTVSRNVLQEIRQNITELQGVAGGDAGMQKSLITDQQLLQSLKAYSTEFNGSSVSQDSPGTLLSVQT